jgi:hypothetical protein
VQLPLAILAIALGTPTTTAHAGHFNYDRPTNARAGVHDATAAWPSTVQLENVVARGVGPPADVRGGELGFDQADVDPVVVVGSGRFGL